MAQFRIAAWTSFDRRRDYEWKVSLGIWTVLATLTGILLSKEIAVSGMVVFGGSLLFVVTIVALQSYWQKGIANANDTDRAVADYYASLMAEELRIPLLPPELKEKMRLRQTGLKSYSHRFQILVTIVLGFALIGVIWLRTHQTTLHATAENQTTVSPPVPK